MGRPYPFSDEESSLGKFYCLKTFIYYISNINMTELSPKFELDCQVAKNYISTFWYIELNYSLREPLTLQDREDKKEPFGTISKLEQV